jgi:hypothetical protein
MKVAPISRILSTCQPGPTSSSMASFNAYRPLFWPETRIIAQIALALPSAPVVPLTLWITFFWKIVDLWRMVY